MNIYSEIARAILSVDDDQLSGLARIEAIMDEHSDELPKEMVEKLHRLVLRSRAIGTTLYVDMLDTVRMYQNAQEKERDDES
jgi:hypothetical protein